MSTLMVTAIAAFNGCLQAIESGVTRHETIDMLDMLRVDNACRIWHVSGGSGSIVPTGQEVRVPAVITDSPTPATK